MDARDILASILFPQSHKDDIPYHVYFKDSAMYHIYLKDSAIEI